MLGTSSSSRVFFSTMAAAGCDVQLFLLRVCLYDKFRIPKARKLLRRKQTCADLSPTALTFRSVFVVFQHERGCLVCCQTSVVVQRAVRLLSPVVERGRFIFSQLRESVPTLSSACSSFYPALVDWQAPSEDAGPSAEAEKPKKSFFGDLTKPPVKAKEEVRQALCRAGYNVAAGP